jgi:hypothetical protein
MDASDQSMGDSLDSVSFPPLKLSAGPFRVRKSVFESHRQNYLNFEAQHCQFFGLVCLRCSSGGFFFTF